MPVSELDEHYAMLDRFLRNNLDDTDYASYSEALDYIYCHNKKASLDESIES